MNEKREYMNVLLKYLMNEKNSEEFQTFLVLLEQIKYQPSLMRYYGEEFINNLKELLHNITDKYDKASIIEAIVQSFFWYESDRSYYEELLNDYIWCLREHATSVNESILCLTSFRHMGFTEHELVAKLVKNLDQEQCILILSGLNWEVPYNLDIEIMDTFKESGVYSNISQRSAIIAQFLLLVNPNIRKYASVSKIKFLYDSYKGVYEDCWPRGLIPNNKDTLIKTKVLSLKEVSILEKLDELINTQEEDLDSIQVRGLYDEFFEDKDPFEVIFTLPL
ncbi:hypothetical protein [Paenibacillus silvae]|uniref:hypothetical protein n=1 Tax=Paenibacillus silvae TaxID=1325358 RepID=UPI0020061FA0|nr:hypothetical protein [Paenibacillus silvae]MCK6076348.1 hypothetical protein [Paenibacillus silvae]MCK6078297.1 hypothetical protein [Paenibacillus silvae]MCK6150493.1 hypothetical protein [Paenibacillus silvae]MCK6268753.1 hypothetical protein [Paenibacillus silvae]MCK6270346.1 hypothetical protein [Paenibacillus silvae]